MDKVVFTRQKRDPPEWLLWILRYFKKDPNPNNRTYRSRLLRRLASKRD